MMSQAQRQCSSTMGRFRCEPTSGTQRANWKTPTSGSDLEMAPHTLPQMYVMLHLSYIFRPETAPLPSLF